MTRTLVYAATYSLEFRRRNDNAAALCTTTSSKAMRRQKYYYFKIFNFRVKLHRIYSVLRFDK